MTQQETGYERRRGFTEVDPGESISYLIVGRTRHGGVEHKKVVYTLNEVKKGRRQLWADSPYLIITVYSFLDKAAPPSIEEDTPTEDTPTRAVSSTGGTGTVFPSNNATWEEIRSAPVQQLNFRGFGDEDTRSGIFNNIQAETMETQEAERLRLRRLEIMNAHAAMVSSGGEEGARLFRQVMDASNEVPDETIETQAERLRRLALRNAHVALMGGEVDEGVIGQVMDRLIEETKLDEIREEEVIRRAYEYASVLIIERESEEILEGLNELLRRQDTDIPF